MPHACKRHRLPLTRHLVQHQSSLFPHLSKFTGHLQSFAQGSFVPCQKSPVQQKLVAHDAFMESDPLFKKSIGQITMQLAIPLFILLRIFLKCLCSILALWGTASSASNTKAMLSVPQARQFKFKCLCLAVQKLCSLPLSPSPSLSLPLSPSLSLPPSVCLSVCFVCLSVCLSWSVLVCSGLFCSVSVCSLRVCLCLSVSACLSLLDMFKTLDDAWPESETCDCPALSKRYIDREKERVDVKE